MTWVIDSNRPHPDTEPRRDAPRAEERQSPRAERTRAVTNRVASAIPGSARGPAGLDWLEFAGRRRHDLEALTAYSDEGDAASWGRRGHPRTP